jgi:hypothetical protein
VESTIAAHADEYHYRLGVDDVELRGSIGGFATGPEICNLQI